MAALAASNLVMIRFAEPHACRVDRKVRRTLAVLTAVLLAPSVQSAGAAAPTPQTGAAVETVNGNTEPGEPSGRIPKPLAVSIALVPGVVAHGAGHFATGDNAAAARLLELELAGVAMAGTGAATFWFSGASRRWAGAATALTLVGGTLFLVSWLADIYGVAMPGAEKGGAPGFETVIHTELGY